MMIAVYVAKSLVCAVQTVTSKIAPWRACKQVRESEGESEARAQQESLVMRALWGVARRAAHVVRKVCAVQVVLEVEGVSGYFVSRWLVSSEVVEVWGCDFKSNWRSRACTCFKSRSAHSCMQHAAGAALLIGSTSMPLNSYTAFTSRVGSALISVHVVTTINKAKGTGMRTHSTTTLVSGQEA